MQLKGNHAGQPTKRLLLDPACKALKCFVALSLAVLLLPIGVFTLDNSDAFADPDGGSQAPLGEAADGSDAKAQGEAQQDGSNAGEGTAAEGDDQDASEPSKTNPDAGATADGDRTEGSGEATDGSGGGTSGEGAGDGANDSGDAGNSGDPDDANDSGDGADPDDPADPVDPVEEDTTAPEVRFFVEKGGDLKEVNDAGEYLQGEEATVVVRVKEENFDASLMAVSVAFDKGAESREDLVWKQDGNDADTHSAEFKLNNKEGSYKIAVTGEDAKGNRIDRAEATVVLDDTRPTVKMEMAGAHASRADDGHPGVDYFDGDVKAVVWVEDDNLAAAGGSPSVSVVRTVDGEAQEAQRVELARSGDAGAWRAEVDFALEEGKTFSSDNSLSVEVSDLAGNRTEAAYGQAPEEGSEDAEFVLGTFDADGGQLEGKSFSIDKKAPTMEASINGDPCLYRAGDDEIGYLFCKLIEGVDDKTLAAPVITLVVGDESGIAQWSVSGAYAEKAEGVAKDGSLTISIRLLEENEFGRDAKVAVVDYAGNTRVWSLDAMGEVNDNAGSSGDNSLKNGDKQLLPLKSIILDKTPPELTFSGVQEGSYSSTTQTARLDVTELNFSYLMKYDPDQTVVTVTKREGDASRAESSWTVPVIAFRAIDPEQGTYYCTQPFESDGHYELSASLTDPAGNPSNVAKLGEFTIDKTPPEVEVAFDNDDVRNGKYYNADRTATVTVTEHNFDPDLVKIETLNGETVAGEDGAVWSDGDAPDTHVATVKFDQEGVCDLRVFGEDMAGSELEYDSGEFVIDKTRPQVAMILDRALVDTDESSRTDYFDGDLSVSVSVVETNMLADDGSADDETVVACEGSGKGGSWSETVQGATYTVSFKEGAGNAVAAEIFDLAGNKTELRYGQPADEAADGDGQFALGTVDANGTTLSGESFVVDASDPKVSIRLNQIKRETFAGVDYFNNMGAGSDELVATVTVTDANFMADGASSAQGKTATKVLKNGVETDVEWMPGKSEGTWVATIAYSEGTGNTIEVTARDWAQNSTTATYGAARGVDASGAKTDSFSGVVDNSGKTLAGTSFTVDLHAPEVASATLDKAPSNNYGTDKGFYFYKNETTMTIVVSDNINLASVSLEDEAKYYMKVNDAFGGKKKTIVVALADGREFTRNVVLTAADVAGNERTWSISPTGTVRDVIGSSAHNTSVDLDNNGAADGVYPQSVIQDTVRPKLAFSGVREGSYSNATQTARLDVTELNFRYLKSYDKNQAVVTVTKQAGNAGRATSSWTVPVSAFQAIDSSKGLYYCTQPFASDGHYTLSASLTDPAGNVGTAKLGEFTIDKTAPTIDVSFDNNDVRNGKYYNAGRTATITVTEHNFDPSLIDINTNGSVGGWSTSGDTHTITVSFASDGTYNLSVSGQDKAGNVLSPYTADEFVVDLTAPAIEFSAVEDAHAYNGTVAPVITFSDSANFNAESVEYTLTGNKVGEVSYDANPSTSSDGMVVTYDDFDHVISVDDIYTLSASVRDMADNEYEESITFSVNRFGSNYVIEAPESEGASADLGYLDEAPQIVVREINVVGIEESSVAVTYNLKTSNLERRDASGQAGYTVRDDSAASGYGWQEYVYTIAPESFQSADDAEGSTDGNYVVVVSSKDKSGNTNSSANFWVGKDDDRASSDDQLDDAAAGAEDGADVAEDGSSATADDDDTVVTETATERQMSAAVKFTLDTTPPDILGLSVDDGGTYKSSGDYAVTFTASDNIGFDADKGLSVRVNGQEVACEVDADGLARFFVPEIPFTFQALDISLADYAGNEKTVSFDDGLKVTSNVFDLYGPYIVAGCAGLVAIVAMLIFFMRKKGKDDEGASASSTASSSIGE